MITLNYLQQIIDQNVDTETVEEAKRALDWMKKVGIDEINQIGRFGMVEVGPGDIVLIKKGTRIKTMNPKYTDGIKFTGRNFKIKVHRVYNGYLDEAWRHDRIENALGKQQGVWAGEGGYWCHANTEDIEIVNRI